MIIPRHKTKKIKVRNIYIGGGASVSIQSMTNLPIEDIDGTIDQINKLFDEGADLIRIAIRNEESIKYLKEIRKAIDAPLSADVHFNHKIAIMAIEAGIDKVRINPGNIGDSNKVREILKAAREHSVPIRIGVNGGSIDRKKYNRVTPSALVESAMGHIKILEDNDFTDIVVSIKSSDIFQTVEANKLFFTQSNYPLHIGLTEAGYGTACIVQSSIVIGHLLLQGIGDTIRVSMTGDPAEEVVIGKKILESIGERFAPVRIISCPTCGRTDPAIDILETAKSVESDITKKFGEELKNINRTIVVAVMGCEVNGPGEASHADVGIAGGRDGSFLLFAGGEKIKKINKNEVNSSLIKEITKIIEGWRK